MASANSSTECSSGNGSSAVPQWKRDLIQRRRQQNKVLTSNGASVKLCSTVSSTLSTNTSILIVDSLTSCEPAERLSSRTIEEHDGGVSASCVLTSKSKISDNTGSCSEYTAAIAATATRLVGSSSKLACQSSCGAASSREASAPAPSSGERPNEAHSGGVPEASDSAPSVVCNMRLEADASSFRSAAGDATGFGNNNNNTSRNNHANVISSVIERGIVDYENYDNSDDTMRNYGNNVAVNNKRTSNNCEQDCENVGGIATRIIRRIDDKTGVCLYPSEQTRNNRSKIETTSKQSSNGKMPGDECESDSSEELQYGPGIVNRLKSKYLNLTLREMNKSRVTVQRFRRAASLEDLLDCDDEPSDKASRKYTKRAATSGVAMKTDRYRNATRGNESMKRARSVETLMRYNSPSGNDEIAQTHRFVALRQEPVNDHIVLIDRTSIKIESRLIDPDRPKAINKPKRIKPLLAETERPPPDLVKTTMRLFEGSVKKVKPKGEVAVKVATFKTINDTYKAQAMKKLVPKPPIQPKPFVNGSAKVPSSPQKISTSAKPTAEIIEKPDQEEYRREGVVTEPLVKSVSSVVSKFQQIERSYTPSASPEPPYKLRFSPSPSPEPSIASKLSRSNDNLLKSPPATPLTSPRLPSPGQSPIKDTARRQTSPVHPPISSSPNDESPRQIFPPEVAKQIARNEDNDRNDSSASIFAGDSRQTPDGLKMEISLDEAKSYDDQTPDRISSKFEGTECVDGSRTITKLALENISKAGTTLQYNFDDKSSIGKTYLPGGNAAIHNGRKSELSKTRNGETTRSDGKMASPVAFDLSSCSSPMSVDSMNNEEPAVKNDRLEEEENRDETNDSTERIASPIYTKPIGAISSLALVKSSANSTTTSAPNDVTGKAIKSQKSDVSPPQKQIGIIRPLVSTKCQQQTQQALSNRELEKNLINRVKSIEQPTKVVVSLKSADEIQPVKKTTESPVSGGGGGGGGLWDTKHWNQANNTMVFNFSNRKDVPDYIENDGLIIRRKREKQKVGDRGVIVLDATLDASTTDDSDWEISGGPPSPCDVSFTNDNVLINGRSNLSKQPRNHKHRIQFDDRATKTFEYPSESSMLEDEGTSVDSDSSSTSQQSSQGANKSNSSSSSSTMSSALLGGGGLASFTPSKVDLASEGFELGMTRTAMPASAPITTNEQTASADSEEYLKSDEDAAAWGVEATADLLY